MDVRVRANKPTHAIGAPRQVLANKNTRTNIRLQTRKRAQNSQPKGKNELCYYICRGRKKNTSRIQKVANGTKI